MFEAIRVILTIVEVLVCVLLITAILIQKSKTQGAGLAFGSGVGETLFGGQIGNVMTRITVILAVVFLVNTTALTYMAVKGKGRQSAPRKEQTTPQSEGGPATAAPASTIPDTPMGDGALPAPSGG